MRLEAYRATWGLIEDYSDAASVLPAVAAEGWDGVAVPVQALKDVDGLRDALTAAGLSVAPQVFSFGRTFDEHIGWVRTGLARAARFEPRVVLGQLGTDAFDEDDAVRFLRESCAIAADLGVTLAHETHRGRPLFHPNRSLRLLGRAPDVRLNADLSHWGVVAESLEWGDELIGMVAERTIHIDARVGSEEAPQVDPRDPANERLLGVFEGWWSAIVAARAAAGDEVLGFTPEYGPPPYQASGDDADRAAITLWARDRIRGVPFRDG